MTEALTINSMKPGVLVVELISVSGGISYERTFLENYLQETRRVREWQTTSVIEDESEYKAARNIRSAAYASIRRVCSNTPAGLICPMGRAADLREAIKEIRKQADEFNSKAKTCRITARYALYSVEPDNQSTIAALAEQVADIAKQVDTAVTIEDARALQQVPSRFLKGLSVQTVMALPESERNAIIARARAELIRKAIGEAKGLDRLLPDNASHEIRDMVKHSRKIAREICHRVEKKSEALEQVLSEVDISGIRRTRAAFVIAAMNADSKAAESIQDLAVEGSVPARKLVDYTDACGTHNPDATVC